MKNPQTTSINFAFPSYCFLVLCLAFISTGWAQNKHCTIYLKDHTQVTGLGKLKLDGQVKFKAKEGDKATFYQADQIDQVLLNENGGTFTYQYKEIQDGSPEWMKLILTGKVNLYTNDLTGFNMNSVSVGMGTGMGMGGGFGGVTFGGGGAPVIYYYVEHDGDSAVYKITAFGTISKNFKRAASEYFKDCPDLVAKIQDKTFTKNDIEELVRLYNTTCVGESPAPVAPETK